MNAAHKTPVRHRRELSLFAVACGGFALLIWFKLRMVTGVPRTAYADPDPPVPPSPNGTIPVGADPQVEEVVVSPEDGGSDLPWS